jgi:hypothetical protein
MNVFPVTATLGDETYTACRLYTDTPSEATVYRWNGTTGEAVWSGPVSVVDRRTWSIETDAGTVTVTRQGGCSCSNPMKRWSPGGRPVRAFGEL